MRIGIDPGWASFGVAVEHEGKTIFKASYVPRDHGDIAGFIMYMTDEMFTHVCEFMEKQDKDVWSYTDVYIERFVAYKGIHSDMSENILMLIGALNYYYASEESSRVHMVRAIDWKPKVCKYLVRTQGFNNPNPSFDKKFSVAAANALSGGDSKVDHEADAICLSYLGLVDIFNDKGKK